MNRRFPGVSPSLFRIPVPVCEYTVSGGNRLPKMDDRHRLTVYVSYTFTLEGSVENIFTEETCGCEYTPGSSFTLRRPS